MERDQETGLLELKLTGLIDRVLNTMGLAVGTAKSKWTPAEAKPLVKDEEGLPMSGDFSYSINCCACYMICPKRSHEAALKQIGWYLKATRDCGLVLNSSKELKIDC
ncbi:hypothetical protein ACHAXS_008171 [Conticribra weissflogii]